ncbi:hypothetical protein PR202_ga17995 [Eleusine coracana subsp. coracana]|uniref:Uncharacterized protein n=1 Tax=Eleusine coracana subsp. coracana TaxID=191504 RepID=A0AAV5CRX0_ELECO|nr:hypothetical protein PR202_ga17995 [Eleusine coracana subsp. coracana]
MGPDRAAMPTGPGSALVVWISPPPPSTSPPPLDLVDASKMKAAAPRWRPQHGAVLGEGGGGAPSDLATFGREEEALAGSAASALKLPRICRLATWPMRSSPDPPPPGERRGHGREVRRERRPMVRKARRASLGLPRAMMMACGCQRRGGPTARKADGEEVEGGGDGQVRR